MIKIPLGGFFKRDRWADRPVLECNQIEKIKKESLLLGGEKQLLLCHMPSSPPQQWSRLHWHARHIAALVEEEINLGLRTASISVYHCGISEDWQLL